ncbi:MAG: hypothetical protein ACOC38_02520 [Promethearchaeia archaeon]
MCRVVDRDNTLIILDEKKNTFLRLTPEHGAANIETQLVIF